MTLDNIIDEMYSLGYEVDKRPYKLNIVGIRDSGISIPKNYSDNIAYFWYDDNGNLQGKVVEGTTTPSVYWLNNLMNPDGSAILKQGQYKDTYVIGLHRRRYEALVQNKPVTVIRDSDRNSILNYFGDTQTGNFGINIHRSTAMWADEDEIGQDSAGCQVFRWRDDFNDMMAKARISKDRYGNVFTYTLIDKREQVQKKRKYAVVGAVIIGLTGYAYLLYKKGIFKN